MAKLIGIVRRTEGQRFLVEANDAIDAINVSGIPKVGDHLIVVESEATHLGSDMFEVITKTEPEVISDELQIINTEPPPVDLNPRPK